MITILHSHDPDRCPRDAKADLNFRTDRDTVRERLEECHGGGRYLRAIVAARVKLDAAADDYAGARVISFHRYLPVPYGGI